MNLDIPSIGNWCQIGHPANAEIMAKADFDWIAADCEHGEFDEYAKTANTAARSPDSISSSLHPKT